MFSAAKDAFTGVAARKYINGRIERYGAVTDLKIDSRRKTLEATCELRGETTPITVRIGRYEIEHVDEKDFIRAADCTCSRPWIANLLEDLVEGRRFEIPGWAKTAL